MTKSDKKGGKKHQKVAKKVTSSQKTIKEIADEIGVTKQAIQYQAKKIDSKHIRKRPDGAFTINSEGQKNIYENMGVRINTEINDTSSKDYKEIFDENYSLLKEELSEKNSQISELQNMLKQQQKLIDQQQQLTLQTYKQNEYLQLELENYKENEIEKSEKEENKNNKWWQFLKRKI